MHSLHTHTLANALNIFCNRVAEYFGFSESDYPAMVIGDLQNESGGIKKFPYSGTVPQLTFCIHTYIRYTLLYDEKTLEHCRGRESFRDFFLQRRIEGHLEKWEAQSWRPSGQREGVERRELRRRRPEQQQGCSRRVLRSLVRPLQESRWVLVATATTSRITSSTTIDTATNPRTTHFFCVW